MVLIRHLSISLRNTRFFRHSAITTFAALLAVVTAVAAQTEAVDSADNNANDERIAHSAHQIIPDTLADDRVANNDVNTVRPEDFTYAGQRRYILGGGLPNVTTDIRWLNAGIVGGTYIGGIVGLHIHQRNAWWKDERGPFHFQDDWEFALQVDKVGHFYGGYTLSYYMTEALLASGFGIDAAHHWGSALGLAYQTYVEIEDGFGTRWGFSKSDMASNALGAGYFLLQYHLPVLQNFTPKWQYVPSAWIGAPELERPTTVFDDYNATSVWMSVNMHNLLPEDAQDYWPAWLDLAVGYGVHGIETDNPHRRYMIGLDYNLVRLLPDGGNFWNWLRQSLNYIKFPSPTLEFGQRTQFRLLYPFKLSVGSVDF